MLHPDKPSILDRIVDWVSTLLDDLGLNGNRLRWKWRQRRFNLGEQGLKAEMAWRATTAKHKMCPECRALVERSAGACPHCGASMAAVSGPGLGRTLANLLPGSSAVTGLILLVNGFVFLALLTAHAKAGLGVGLFGGFEPETLVRFGSGLSQPSMLADGVVTGGETWRLVTPIFMHGSLLHFFFNSFWLVQLGPLTQDIFGSRYWIIYLLCGIAGNMASQWTHSVNTVGASGAIAGLFGLLLVHGLRNRSQLGEAMKSLLFRLIGYSVVMALMALPVDHRAHAGGFLCGAFLAWILPDREPQTAAGTLAVKVVSFLGVLLVLASFAMVAEFNK